MSVHALNEREHATVLAALRLYDYVAAEWPDIIGEADVEDVATRGGELRTLNGLEIDQLCERLNADNGPTALIEELVAYEREQFDGPTDEDPSVNGADLVDWFTQIRQRVKALLK